MGGRTPATLVSSLHRKTYARQFKIYRGPFWTYRSPFGINRGKFSRKLFIRPTLLQLFSKTSSTFPLRNYLFDVVFIFRKIAFFKIFSPLCHPVFLYVILSKAKDLIAYLSFIAELHRNYFKSREYEVYENMNQGRCWLYKYDFFRLLCLDFFIFKIYFIVLHCSFAE